jgi:hypothetical protein
MIELVVVSLAVAGTVLTRVVMSRPPKHGIAQGLEGQLAHGVIPGQTIPDGLPPASRLLGPPPTPPIREALAATPPLPLPETPLALLGVEVDRSEDERQLWLLVRDRLAKRAR